MTPARRSLRSAAGALAALCVAAACASVLGIEERKRDPQLGGNAGGAEAGAADGAPAGSSGTGGGAGDGGASGAAAAPPEAGSPDGVVACVDGEACDASTGKSICRGGECVACTPGEDSACTAAYGGGTACHVCAPPGECVPTGCPAACGDGKRDAAEQCDQMDLGGKTCADFGLGAGALTCNANCTIATGGCTDPTCVPPRKLCGTICADTSNDPMHCGACNRFCPAPCQGGQCMDCATPCAGFACGMVMNACGTFDCGSCAAGFSCNAARMCVPGCTPTTCADQGANCGTLANGCGGTIMCGSCAAPATCGGGGTPNVCGTLPSCTDGEKNGSETGLDCGGPGGCPRCQPGEQCMVATDCLSSVCVGGVCTAPSCTDGVRNGLESDTDCGGLCPKCASGRACQSPADCQSGVCGGNLCQP